MPIYSKKEFAALCGMATNGLAVYIKRNKVVATGETIDTNIAENAAFLASHAKPEKPVKSKPSSPNIRSEVVTPAQTDQTGNKNLDISRAQALLDAKETELKNQLLAFKRDKLQGKLIPTDLVRILIQQLAKHFVTGIQQAADNVVTEFGALKNLDNQEIAELRIKVLKLANKTGNDAITQAQRGIENIVTEYSQLRAAGEKI